MLYTAYDIEWNTDDFGEEDAVAMGTDEPLWMLPDEVEEIEIPDDTPEYDVDDAICEKLSNEYGFCIKGFRYRRQEGE